MKPENPLLRERIKGDLNLPPKTKIYEYLKICYRFISSLSGV